MTIKDFITKYAPGMSDNEFMVICNSIGMNLSYGYDKNTALNDAQINRLITNNRINTYRISTTIIKDHDNLLNEYDETLRYYDSLLAHDPDHPEKDKILPQDRKGLQEIRDRLGKERYEYAGFVSAMNARNTSSYNNSLYDSYGGYGSIIDNSIAQAYVDSKQDKIENKETKINENFERLNDLEEKLNDARTNRKKKAYQKEIEKVRNKIQILQNKKGKIETKQRRVINRNAKRLKSRMENNLNINLSEARREGAYVVSRRNTQSKIDDVKSDYDVSKHELEELRKSNKIGDKFKAVGKKQEIKALERDNKKLESKMDSLSRKNGRAEIINQFHREMHSYVYN